MTRRVLVLSASVGAGHLRAAEAVELALRKLAPSAEVENIDVLTLTNAAFRKVYGRAYIDLVNKAPHVLGYFYDMMDRPTSPRHKSDRLRLLVEKLNLGRFLRLLKINTWDIVINTHFLPAEIIASLQKTGDFSVPHFTVTTDFETHRLWVNQPCDRYFTATEEGAINLQHWGVPADDTAVSGIPIHPAFSEPKDRASTAASLGLDGNRPTILQLAGGFGVGPVEQIYRALLSLEPAVQLVVVAGRNENLKNALERVEVPGRHRAKVVGFTAEMDQWMSASDVVVSKPGGLTTSETLACGAAMVVVNPIPGQESRNSDFLLENDAAIKVNNIATLSYKLTALLKDTARLERMKRNSLVLGKPRAAFDIAAAALNWKTA
jgi:processive 1,2-diacylglycerol beta-glucosyltransferase